MGGLPSFLCVCGFLFRELLCFVEVDSLCGVRIFAMLDSPTFRQPMSCYHMATIVTESSRRASRQSERLWVLAMASEQVFRYIQA